MVLRIVTLIKLPEERALGNCRDIERDSLTFNIDPKKKPMA